MAEYPPLQFWPHMTNYYSILATQPPNGTININGKILFDWVHKITIIRIQAGSRFLFIAAQTLKIHFILIILMLLIGPRIIVKASYRKLWFGI